MIRARYLAAVLVGLALGLGLGCGSAQPPPPQTASNVEQTSSQQPSQSMVVRPFTQTGVYIDASIASACNLSVPEAFFAYDSADVAASQTTVLDKLASCASSGPLKGKTLRVEGHTDPRGPDQYNQQLGKSRAQAVADYLSSKGLEKTNLNVVSQGERQAVGTDEQGWAYDRRVDIKLEQRP